LVLVVLERLVKMATPEITQFLHHLLRLAGVLALETLQAHQIVMAVLAVETR
jgi:hypothetical protein